jgi:DNA-binding transcriptional LysR family regulator
VIRDVVAGAVNALVRNEEADIGLTGGGIQDSTLEVLHTGTDRLVAVFPKTHSMAKQRKKFGIRELLRSPLVLTAPGTSVRAAVDSAFAQTGEQPTIASETTYTMTAVAMVRAGLGVSILPESARELRAEPELVTNVIEHPSFVRPIALIKKTGPHASSSDRAVYCPATRRVGRRRAPPMKVGAYDLSTRLASCCMNTFSA